MGAGQPVPGRAMAGPESEAPRQDWRQAAGQDVASVGEDDERPEKEQRDAAAESSCIPIDIGGEGGRRGRRKRRKRKRKRRGGKESWKTGGQASGRPSGGGRGATGRLANSTTRC